MGYYYKMVPDGTYCLTGYEGKDKHIELPANITVSILNDKLYKNHTEIESINLPDSITEIGGFVFDGCSSLKAITLPPNLNDMWQYALTRMNIETIIIPGSLKAIVPFAFNECHALKTVTINEGVKEIHGWAFKDCIAITDVYLPKSVIKIHDDAFSGCKDITFHKKD